MSEEEKLNILTKKLNSIEQELASLRNEIHSFRSEKKDPAIKPVSIQTKPAVAPVQIPKRKVINPEAELLLGGNIIGKFGLVTIILASAWFIKFAFDHRWINESGRIYIGMTIGFGISIIGVYLASKKFRILPESIFGTGISILYLSIFGGYYYYNLIGTEETFIMLVILSLGTSIIASNNGQQILYIFGIAGSIVSPVLMSSGENSYRFLFTYMTAVNLLFLYASRKNSWSISPFLLVASNVIVFSTWASINLVRSSFAFPFIFLSFFLAIFLFRELVLMPLLRKKTSDDSIVMVILTLLSYVSLAYWTVNKFHPNLTSHFFLFLAFVLIGFIELFDRKGIVPIEKQNSGTKLMKTILLISWVAVFFAAISDFSEGNWLTLSWILFAASVSVMGSIDRNRIFILISLLLWMLSLGRLFFVESLENADYIFLFNPRFALFFLASAFLLLVYHLQKTNPLHSFMRGFVFAALFSIIVGTLVENRYLVRNLHYRNLGYSYVLAFYAAATLIPGFILSYKSFRISGMAVIGILLLKLYLYDIWTMSLLVRIIAAFSLGGGLVLLSFVYQKYKNKVTDT
ncbi:MAG: DUF2339 domain-containing protein [Leptospira sp.]|nr:DUF2339 domain-containing protein [Leptospira sp.]